MQHMQAHGFIYCNKVQGCERSQEDLAPMRDGLFLPQLLTFPSPPLETVNRQHSSILPAENKQCACTKAPLAHSGRA